MKSWEGYKQDVIFNYKLGWERKHINHIEGK